MLEAGLDDRAVSDLLGHVDTWFTSRVYAHPTDEIKKGGMDTLGSAFG